jgi:hypothetical protein
VPGCTERPPVAILHNHVELDGSWYCHSHRYPPCSICRVTPRPASAISGKIKFKDWVCYACKGAQTPGGNEVEESSTVDKTDVSACTQCRKPKSKAEMARKKTKSGTRILDRCNDCAYPVCASCGRRSKVEEGPVRRPKPGHEDKPWYLRPKPC